MEFKNLISYKGFLQIKEAKEFTNDTTWSESLLGKAVGSLLKLFGNGLSNAVFLHSIRNIKGVILEGVETYLSGGTSNITNTTTVKPSDETTSDINTGDISILPDKETGVVNGDKTTALNLQFKFGDENLELKKIEITNEDGTKSYIDVDKRGQEVLAQLKDSKEVKSVINNDFFNDVINNSSISEISRKINETIKIYQKNADEIKKIEATNPKDKKVLNDLELKKNKLKSLKLQIIYDKADLMLLKFKFVKLRETVKKLGGQLSDYGELFINGQRVDFETLQPLIKPDSDNVEGSEDKKSVDTEFNDVKNGKIIKKKKELENSGKIGETFFYLEDEIINEALLGGFTRYNKKIEELTIQHKNKIDKEAATKKINLSKLYAYHLLADRQIIKNDGTRDAKLENIWKQDMYKALSRFNDLINVERVNPFSPSFALNKEQKDNIEKETKDKVEATNTALGTGNNVAERVKRIGLSENQVPAEYLKGKGINDLYMLNFKWATRGKTTTEFEAMVAVKYINIGGFDALCMIDTYSKEFMDSYDISKNKIKNVKDINLITFLIGTSFNMESGGTQSIKSASDYTPCFIFKNKLKFPITTLFITNEVHVFNILKVNDKDDVFIPTLTTKHQETTTSDTIKKAVMNDNLYKKKLNIISVDIYPVFGIPKETSGEYVTKNKIDINIINNYANEIKAYFQKLSLI
jgi:hypothetical protein